MKEVKVTEAVGMVLCHDVTKIVPGQFKGAAYKKGHVIKQEDVDKLLDMGKEHIFVLELGPNELHEDDAALEIAKNICGPGVYYNSPKEGKINIHACDDGLIKIHKDLLYQLNDIGDICIATIHSNSLVKKDQIVAGTRVVPLTIDRQVIEELTLLSVGTRLIELKPIKPLKTAIIVTGSEVYKGRIEDKFGPVVKNKLEQLQCKVIFYEIVPDSIGEIIDAIDRAVGYDAEMVLVTGGMSVDPDDKTPGAIRSFCDEMIMYGTPVLPGSMLALGYKDNMPILGLPGCVMYSKITVFDLVLHKLLTGERLKRKDIVEMGYGGLCLNCEVCTYPKCSFGKY